MTANQIAYWSHNETKRHNVVSERETERHNRATEAIQGSQVGVSQYVARENARHNLVIEGIQQATQVANASHMERQDAEATRHNTETERISNWQAQIAQSNLELAQKKQNFDEWEKSQQLIIDQSELADKQRRTANEERKTEIDALRAWDERRRTNVQIANAWTQGFRNVTDGVHSIARTVTNFLPILNSGN